MNHSLSNAISVTKGNEGYYIARHQSHRKLIAQGNSQGEAIDLLQLMIQEHSTLVQEPSQKYPDYPTQSPLIGRASEDNTDYNTPEGS